MPNITIDYGADTIDLWQPDQDRDARQGNVDAQSKPTFDSDEAFLSGLTENHSHTLTGTATGFRLSDQGGYSSDPATALAEWAQEMMTLVNGQQGTGYTLDHSLRGLNVNMAIEEFSWTRRQGAPFELDWDLSFRIGTASMVDTTTSANTASPSSTWKLDGTDLQNPREYSETKRQPLAVEEQLDVASAEENIIKTQAGAQREVTITGRHTGDTPTRRGFDDTMKALVGSNQIVTYESPFPGHNLSVMVDNYDSTLEAGATRHTDYTLKLIEGTN